METLYKMTRAETKLAELLWSKGSIGSVDLIKLAEVEYDWKKSNTLTNLKSLVEKGLAKNESSGASMLYTRDEIVAEQSRNYIDEAFGGSLPMFFVSYTSDRVVPVEQLDLLKRLIAKHERDNAPPEAAAPEKPAQEAATPEEDAEGK